MFQTMIVIKRLIPWMFAVLLVACGSSPPETDFSDAEQARESFGLVTADLSDRDRNRVVDTLAWTLLALDGMPEAEPGTRTHQDMRGEIAAMTDPAIVERLADAGFGGLAGPGLMDRAAGILAERVGAAMGQAGIALADAKIPLDDYRTARDTARIRLSPLGIADADIDRGVIHQADRARLRATIENGFDRPIVRVQLDVALRDRESNTRADADVTVRLDRPLLPGRRMTIEGLGGLADDLDGDLAARYAGQRHRGAVSALASRVEFEDGSSIDSARPPTPGVLNRIDRLRERHEAWIERYRSARSLSVDWTPAEDRDKAAGEGTAENGGNVHPGGGPPGTQSPLSFIPLPDAAQGIPDTMTKFATREFITNETA
ncbi:hypothetical protein [Fodinicurvata sp. EGI_FJ10296]|uniref:hypothetical protein n=1 Tax=Fodinicurvata sp. EGI_FJ10296 TaxID=3231908 RepID=UPI003455BC4B